MKTLLHAVLVLVSCSLSAQTFEGTITYTTDIRLGDSFAKMGIKKEDILEKLRKENDWSDSLIYYYKGNQYASVLPSSPPQWTVYRPGDNHIYIWKEGAVSCSVTDAAKDSEQEMGMGSPVIKQLDSTGMVNGFKCNIVQVKWKSGSYYYYYDPKQLTANPQDYSKHVYDGFSEYLKISKALPLRIVKEAGGIMTVVHTYKRVIKNTVDQKVFTIPDLVDDESLNLVKLPISKVMRIKQKPSSPAEDLFVKYLDTDSDEDLKKVLDSNDGVYSIYAKAVSSEDPTERIKLLNEFLDKKTNHGRILGFLIRGYAHFAKGEFNDAVTDADASLALQSEDPYPHLLKAQSFVQLEKYDAAVDAATKALSFKKDLTDALFIRGLSNRKLEKYNESIADLKLCIKANPKDPSFYEHLGSTYRDMGDYKQAIVTWKEALKFATDEKEALQKAIQAAEEKLKAKKG